MAHCRFVAKWAMKFDILLELTTYSPKNAWQCAFILSVARLAPRDPGSPAHDDAGVRQSAA